MQIIITIPGPGVVLRQWKAGLLAAFLLLALTAGGAGPVAALGNSISSPDTAYSESFSLALDAAGNPVIAYQGSPGLKVLHCNDANCAGGGDVITSPDVGPNPAYYVSMKLDALGNPVVSYWAQGLKILHCNDANCAGGDDTITLPDSGGSSTGQYTALVLDAVGYPIVSYRDGANDAVKLMHCNDANCSGGDESIVTAATGGSPGFSRWLTLDASGSPVLSYRGAGGLTILHCNDANCIGGDESIVSVDSSNDAGIDPSLVLDAAGNPVVSYLAGYQGGTSDAHLKVLHCNDPDCAGSDDSMTVADPDRNVGHYTSLALDGSGNPVVSYGKETYVPPMYGGSLKVLRCNDANCAGGDDTITTPEEGPTAVLSSLALDAAGRPVVAYRGTAENLSVLHCSDIYCAGLKGPPQIDITNLGQYALPKACFEVRNTAQNPLFVVCDNNFQGALATNAACVPDGICQDEDSADGSVRVTVADGAYSVQQNSQSPNHGLDLTNRACSTAGKPSCGVTFVGAPNTHPWHPWDITGPGGVPDGLVRIQDILAVVQHYYQDKP